MNQDDPANPQQPQPAPPGQSATPGQPAAAPPGAPAQPAPFAQPAAPQVQPAVAPAQPDYAQQAQQAQAQMQQGQPGYPPMQPQDYAQQQQAQAQAQQAQAAQAMGRLEINTSFFPLAFILLAVTPVLTLNGQSWPQKWGGSFYDLPPGEHHLQCWFPYLFTDRCGPAQMMLPIYAGHVTRVSYEAPFFMFSNGTMQNLGAFPL